MADVPDRLDSWKAIAAYLNRDERTVRRWERQGGLPVRRMPGGRGASVFAYAGELDAWLTSHPPSSRGAAAATEDASPALSDAAADVQPQPRALSIRPVWALAALAVVAAAAVGATVSLRGPATEPSVRLVPQGLIASAGGREQWRYDFDGDRVELPQYRGTAVDRIGGAHPGLVAGTAWRIAKGEVVHNGELLELSLTGHVQQTFAFEDRLVFGAGTYDGPWGLTDFRVNERGGSPRIAIAAHHHEWWPSLVTVLDEHWRRLGTFVNAGWAERVEWLTPDRLVIAGFFEPLDGGMVALLDANALDGQSPAAGDERFHCTGCGSHAPLRYVVLPRSEVNRASGSPFNRASIQMDPDRIIVHTSETPPDAVGSAVDAIYEFTPSLELVSAAFSDRYWERHRQLEAAGMLTHTRDNCPERNGPRAIDTWEPGSGWRTVPVANAARR